jgi:hypothetical protein
LNQRDLIILESRESLIAWDPTLEWPVTEFQVSGAFGINSADHRRIDDSLESVVVTTDGSVHHLVDLREIRTDDARARRFVSCVNLLPDGRIFALQTSSLPILELVDGHCSERLTAGELLEQIGQRPLLGEFWRQRLKEYADWYKGLRSRNGPNLRAVFQHPVLSRAVVFGRTVLTMVVQLSSYTTDSLVLLIDPDEEPLRVIGHFVVPSQLVADFDLQTDPAGATLRLVCALLSDFELGYDLVLWARGVETNDGIVFVQEGSTLRTKDDLIYIALGNDGIGFAADDSGGLFRFSTKDKSWSEVARNESSRIRGLKNLKSSGT